MKANYLDLYQRAGAWTTDKITGATGHLDAPTPCDEWDVRTLLNHMLDTQRFFLASARGEEAALSTASPPELLSDDPVVDFEKIHAEMVETFGQPGVMDKTGPALGIAFSDLLIHGWDVAQATKQDATMPEGLAQVAFDTIHGRFTDEQRKGVFKPEVVVGADRSAQDQLLAYVGRDPS